MAKLSLTRIKAELEKKATLSDKKTYLEDLLKKIKGKKLRAAVEKLLKRATEHEEHVEKFSKEKLESRIIAETPAAEEPIVERKSFGEIRKYRQVEREPERSGLEKEVAAFPAAKFVEGHPKYIALASGSYMGFGEAKEQARLLLEEKGLMHRMTADQFYNMDPMQKQTLFATVNEAVGGVSNYYQLTEIVKGVAVAPGKEKGKKEDLYTRTQW